MPALRNERSPRAFVASGHGGRAPGALLPLPSASAPRVDPPRESVRRHVLLKTPPRRDIDEIHLITVKEAAALFKVHASTLYRMIQRGELPGVFRVGSDWRIDADMMWKGLAGR